MSEHRPAVWHDDHNDPCDPDNADAYCPACEEFWPCKAALQDRIASLEAALSVERLGDAIFAYWQEQYGPARSAASSEQVQARDMAAALLAALKGDSE